MSGKETWQKFNITPPVPKTCPECATMHAPREPHNCLSLYYQVKFRQRHGRAPTWEDAMAHCDEDVKRQWTEALKDQGVSIAEMARERREQTGEGTAKDE